MQERPVATRKGRVNVPFDEELGDGTTASVGGGVPLDSQFTVRHDRDGDKEAKKWY